MTSACEIHLGRSVATAVTPGSRVMEVAAMFGLGVDESRTLTIIPPCTLPLRGGSVIFITGPSGGGKSTILSQIAQQAPEVHTFAGLEPLPTAPLVEQIGETLPDALRALSLAGLGDAFIMLRTPEELSDGQRYRFQLARLIDRIRRRQRPDSGLRIILADEFGATLDRHMARTVAANLTRWVRSRDDLCFVAATTHDDLLEALCPDVLVHVAGAGSVEILHHPGQLP